MKAKIKISWKIWVGLGLIGLSVFIYSMRVAIFGEAREMARYLADDIAFMLVQILVVTLVVDEILRRREKQAMKSKMNMVIGSFFSEVGNGLIKALSGFDPQSSEISGRFFVDNNWTGKDFARLGRELASYGDSVDAKNGDLAALKSFLAQKRQFLLILLENPNLLEQEHFTSLLWAVFHLTEELMARSDLSGLPAEDLKHLSVDIKRSYTLLMREWLAYMMHLKHFYPYLFSLAVRLNPFNPCASAVVCEK